MTNLDSILKRRGNFATKVHLVKAMVFPVVMYGCESWALKKAEGQRIDAFELWCWKRLLCGEGLGACSDFGAQENKVSLFPLFPHLFAMK